MAHAAAGGRPKTAAEMGIMVGSPPSRVVDLAAWDKGPDNRWAFQHISEIIPTTVVSRGVGLPRPLVEVSGDVSSVVVDDADSCVTVADVLSATYTDGFIVLTGGEIVHEQYFNEMGPATRHLLMSVSKSMVGTLAGIFVEDGSLHPERPVTDYVPELRMSPGFADAMVRDVLDMTTAIEFSEEYDDPDSEVVAHERAMAWRGPSATAEQGLYAFATTVDRADRRRGELFHYASINADVLGWLIERIAGMRFADVMSEAIWTRLGCDHDALLSVDLKGSAVVNGGFCVTLRDLARFGQMILDGGRANGSQIVPAAWIDDIRYDGNNAVWLPTQYAELWPHGWYRNQWYVTGDDHGSFFAMGVNGQHIWIDPTTRVVIVKLSSQPKSVDVPATALALRAMEAIARTEKFSSTAEPI
ncbi:MAG: serine hydrolase [Acidimicrobiia bacterium]|nr:serine hydrolase [Acidimicrobiia bacterium]